MLEWIPNKELQILDIPLKSMTKIPNKLKTEAAKVFDVFLKENEVNFRIGKLDIWHFKSLKWEDKSPRLVIRRRFVTIFKLCQKNFDFDMTKCAIMVPHNNM